MWSATSICFPQNTWELVAKFWAMIHKPRDSGKFFALQTGTVLNCFLYSSVFLPRMWKPCLIVYNHLLTKWYMHEGESICLIKKVALSSHHKKTGISFSPIHSLGAIKGNDINMASPQAYYCFKFFQTLTHLTLLATFTHTRSNYSCKEQLFKFYR